MGERERKHGAASAALVVCVHRRQCERERRETQESEGIGKPAAAVAIRLAVGGADLRCQRRSGRDAPFRQR